MVRRCFFLPTKLSRPEEFVNVNHTGFGRGTSRARILSAGTLLLAAAIAVLVLSRVEVGRTSGLAATNGYPSLANPLDSLRIARAPIFFEPNLGQTSSEVRFIARGAGYGLFLTRDEAVLKLRGKASAASPVVRMRLSGASPSPRVSGAQQLSGISNYLLGKDPARWRRGVPQYARVHYQDVYPGIDLVYYGTQGKLEFDFEVAPHADPSQIALTFAGPEQASLGTGGDLLVETLGANLKFHAPRIYQRIAGHEHAIRGKFLMLAQNKVAFDIGPYDHNHPLIIDPVLSYSSFLGGAGSESAPFVAVDNALNLYVCGSTTSADFPLKGPVTSPYDGSVLNGAQDVFISKFDANNTLVYSTYLGGSGTDTAAGIASDPITGNVTVAGTTDSSDFPTLNAYQSAAKASGTHAFVTQLAASGAALLYSSYLSGSGTDTATGVALDTKGNAFVTGTTTSSDFPVFPNPGAFQTSSRATNQFFATEFSTTATGDASLVYSTYFGGTSPSDGVTVGGGIAVDPSGNFYITGGTTFTNTGASNDFPILNAYQSTIGGGKDAFVAKFGNPTASTNAGALLYSTYVGGSGDDVGNAIAVDNTGNAYVVGSSSSTETFTGSVTGFQTANKGGASDAFVAKIGSAPASGHTEFPLNYFSYLGGSGADIGLAIAVDSSQGAHIAGSTDSTDFNTSHPVQDALKGGTDAFVALLSTTGSTTSTSQGTYSTYLGGAGADRGTGVAVDFNGLTYVAGETASGDFPTAGSPFQGALNGPMDAFITKLGSSSTLVVTPSLAPSAGTVGVGNQASFIYTITNQGPDTAFNVQLQDVLPATGATFTSSSSSPGSCTPPASGVVNCAIGNLAVNQSATVTIIVTPTSSGTLGNSATVTSNGGQTVSSQSPVMTVSDFSLSASPDTNTVTAGQPATYTITVTPIPTYPESISLACTSGIPSGGSCSFSVTPVTISNTSASTSQLVINTTARVTTTAGLRELGPVYAVWLPFSGLAFLGLGLRGKLSRKQRILGGMTFTLLLSLLLLLPACGGSKKSTTTTTGTPAGTYTVTVSGSSGSASRTAVVTLVVQ